MIYVKVLKDINKIFRIKLETNNSQSNNNYQKWERRIPSREAVGEAHKVRAVIVTFMQMAEGPTEEMGGIQRCIK